ncbi:MAG: hypothetical protein HQ481_21300 [Alphaproteobacteria bacterium]|nr:hypothetical protein [Alphaproteobacteria bacterium]
MFGRTKEKPAAKGSSKTAAKPAVKLGTAIVGEEELDIRELHLKGLRIPNPGEGNIITGQQFRFVLRLGEGDNAVNVNTTASAVAASATEVIGKFAGMDDDSKRLIALHLKALRAVGAIK